ncbi:MAG: GNAT family N-acetyltransferase [Candidatus Omnitrophica bacterium]|nr:GNAT family N-acetyltransferase [Candidatus Omnitrophota bacterium]
MQTKPELKFSVVRSIKDIPRSDWESLFAQDIIEDYGYHKTLEESRLKEFSFGYLLGKSGGKALIIIPFFTMDFSFDKLIGPPVHRFIILIQSWLKRNIFSMRVLFLGAPTAEEFYMGYSESLDFKRTFGKALNEIYRFSRKNRVNAIAFNNLSCKNKELNNYLKDKQFIHLETLPNTILEVKAGSLEDYIARLGPSTRKDLRRKIRNSASQVTLRTEIRDNIDDILPVIYRLYLNNFNNSEVNFEILTPEFFRSVFKNMPGTAKCFLTYDKNKIVAFNLALIKGDTFIDKFIGFDPEVSHKYHLYYMTFCHNYEWCLKNGIKKYQLGVTDYHPKLRLGAKLLPLHIYTKSFNPALNLLVRIFAKFLQPKNLDDSLNDYPKKEYINGG